MQKYAQRIICKNIENIQNRVYSDIQGAEKSFLLAAEKHWRIQFCALKFRLWL